MVVFTCNHCGDSLQKPRVEKHYNFVCRTVKSLTCIDCLKDFRGEEYVNHTKCLTEEERYAAKGAYVNGIIKKGEVKQESWIEMIKSIIETETNLKPSIRNLLNTISNYDNIPRKKPKFLNFIKSSSGGRANMKEVEEVWNIIEKYKADQLKAKEENSTKLHENGATEDKKTSNNNDTANVNDVKKKKKKTKTDETVIGENIEKNETEITEETSKQRHKKKKSVENEKTTEEKIIKSEQENIESNETEVKTNKKNKKSKKSKTEHLEIDGSTLTNGGTENLGNMDCIQNGGLKNKSKKKKLQDVENEEMSNHKKPKLDITNEENLDIKKSEEQMDIEDNFDFKQKIIEILTSKGSISVKKLEKKVTNAYLKHFGLSESSQKIIKKFNKKLKKLDNIEIVDDNITLKT